MGLDGGTIISRSDVLRGASWELSQADTSHSTRGGTVGTATVYKKRKLAAREDKRVRWSACALTGEPLAPPIVADYLGSLYNKETVLQFLLARQGVFTDETAAHKYINQVRTSGTLDHIRTTKDVFPVHITVAPVAEDAPYHCPVTDVGCDRAPFVALARCGHVVSERAATDAGQHGGLCPLCSKKFGDGDMVPINPAEEVKAAMEAALKERSGKKAKRRKRPTAEEEEDA